MAIGGEALRTQEMNVVADLGEENVGFPRLWAIGDNDEP